MVACSPSYSEGWGRRIICTREAEVAVSWDSATALQPGNRVRLHLKTKTKQKQQQRKNPFTYMSSCECRFSFPLEIPGNDLLDCMVSFNLPQIFLFLVFWDKVSLLSPKLECSSMIMAHCSLDHLLGLSDPLTSASQAVELQVCTTKPS